ncbi:MAG: phage antirepressor KilAC domain-containing protein [Prevotella sp.]|nr:phage antirepressor KilAC domain-containing protein [Prevotella sp.]
MKTNIEIFTSEIFGEIRTCLVNNQIMFVGKDVAQALGYKNPSNALQVHVDSEDKTSYLIQVSGSNYKANTLFVNESGLYALILSSKLPQAKAFKRWVTSEVLPSIRKTGRYELPQQIPALAMLNAEAEDTLTATQVAKTFNMTTQDFNSILRDMGIQYRRFGRWNISDDLEGRDLVRLRTHISYSLKGEKKVRTYMTWTLEGLRFLNSKLGYPNF